MKNYRSDDIIYALATGWTKSALAIIRASGKGCVAAFSCCFSHPKQLLASPSGTLLHGFVSTKEGERIDEVMLSVSRDGHGYTGEEAFEITCHGSLVGVTRILAVCASLGFRQAEGGEFTYRAFLNGKMDLTQAEAVEEMVDSMSEKGQSMALSRLCGFLGKKLAELRKRYLAVMASVEVQLDYSEDELDEFVYPETQLEAIRSEMLRLAGTYQVGKIYGEGAKVVLAGRTNVGKSSLFNLLLHCDRAIVSPVPGTTRDYLEEHCVFGGIPVRLYDTAGLRESGDEVEKEGIGRTRALLEGADVVVFLHEDGDEVPEDERILPVWAKTDKEKHEGLGISSETGEGVDRLITAIVAKLKNHLPVEDDEGIVVQSKRQYDLLVDSAEAIGRADACERSGVPLDIVAGILQEGLSSLGEITGFVTSTEILETIFSGFCVGK